MDTRGASPILVVADRRNNRLQRFTLDGAARRLHPRLPAAVPLRRAQGPGRRPRPARPRDADGQDERASSRTSATRRIRSGTTRCAAGRAKGSSPAGSSARTAPASTTTATSSSSSGSKSDASRSCARSSVRITWQQRRVEFSHCSRDWRLGTPSVNRPRTCPAMASATGTLAESADSKVARGRSFRGTQQSKTRQWLFGETTDDTERTIAVARAVLRDGEVTHASVGRELLTCRKCVHPGLKSLWEFHEAGDAARVTLDHNGCGAAVRVAPVGILYRSHRLDDIVAGAHQASISTHGGPLGLAAAAATAAAVSAAIDGAAPGEILRLAQIAGERAEQKRSGSRDDRVRASRRLGPRRLDPITGTRCG